MRPGFRAFLTNLIDYAGLFPPATLDLGPAIRNHLRYRLGPDAWMLERFIVPAARLSDLDAFADELRESARAAGEPVRFSVLGLGDVPGGLAEATEATFDVARQFEARHRGSVRADRFEMRTTPAEVDAGLAGPLLAMDLGADDALAVEVPLVGETYSRDRAEHAAHDIAETNARLSTQRAALKLRCGGVTPDLVPSVESVAHAIVSCRDAGAPFKATAGLHHLLPNHDEAVGTRMHGFLGVFGGACLAHAHGLDADALAEVLDDDDPAHFSFADDVVWRSLRVSPETVQHVRQVRALSFGSCSFDEPRDDLRALGWLGEGG
ncbi:MAG: hypothetical protein AAGI52_12825 [Bacteroidota bacterium]